MSTHVAFEVQAYRNESWQIEAVYDDESMAIEDALRLNRRNTVRSVRVVRETYDTDSDQSNYKVVYRSPDLVEIGGRRRPAGQNGRNGTRRHDARGGGRGDAWDGRERRRIAQPKRFSAAFQIGLLLVLAVALLIGIQIAGTLN